MSAKGAAAQTQQVLMALETSGAEMKAMLAQILKWLDDGAALSTQRHEEQAAFNAQVSQDLQACRKQIDLTPADVDEVRQAASAAAPPPPARAQAVDHHAAAAAFVALGLGVPGYPHLANDGAPLLPELPANQIVHPQPVRRNVETVPRMDLGGDGGYVKPPKHDFPRFDGSLPKLWFDRCSSYFDMYRVQPHQWVTTASVYMEGHAALWL